MSTLARIGVALDSALLKQFDAYLERRKYGNRSEGFRDLIRDALIGEKTDDPSQPSVGTLTLVYDHHTRSLSEKLTAMQHDHAELVIYAPRPPGSSQLLGGAGIAGSGGQDPAVGGRHYRHQGRAAWSVDDDGGWLNRGVQ